MTDVPTTRPIAFDGASADNAPRWPASAALLTAWICPATTAHRTAHVPLARAWGLHILAAVLTTVLMFVLVCWEDTLGRDRTIWHAMDRGLSGVWRDIRRWPGEVALLIAGIIASIEVGFLILGVLLMPWGARHERVRASLANALRRAWLHTAHALPLTLLIGASALSLTAAHRAYFAHQPPFSPPQTPPALTTAPVGTAAWAEYSAALNTYHEEYRAYWDAYRRRQPWCVRYNELILAYVCFAGATWFLWALLRAVGARRHVPPAARPPMCEFCGYNLTAAPMEGRCPECGEPVLNSLGPDVRPGTPWQRRRQLGFCRAWWRSSVDPILRPSRFGRQVQVASDTTDHRWFLAMHLLPAFFIGATGLLFCYVADTGRNPLTRDPEILYAIGPFVGYLTAAILLFYAMFAAVLMGLIYRAGDRRNLMAATMQIASYLSGYVLLWAVFAAAMGVAVFALDDLFKGLEVVLRMDDEALAFFAWFLPILACAALYLVLLARATAAARYANR